VAKTRVKLANHSKNLSSVGITFNNYLKRDKSLLEMSSNRRWAVTIGVITGMFIAALETTVVGTAMPTVIASLGGKNHYSWVFTAYIVTSTVTVPVWENYPISKHTTVKRSLLKSVM
jgi:hypothetical protein